MTEHIKDPDKYPRHTRKVTEKDLSLTDSNDKDGEAARNRVYTAETAEDSLTIVANAVPATATAVEVRVLWDSLFYSTVIVAKRNDVDRKFVVDTKGKYKTGYGRLLGLKNVILDSLRKSSQFAALDIVARSLALKKMDDKGLKGLDVGELRTLTNIARDLERMGESEGDAPKEAKPDPQTVRDKAAAFAKSHRESA